jgi:hypothetical protein
MRCQSEDSTMTTEPQIQRAGGTVRAALLAAGDVAALIAFAALGRASHGEAAGLDAFAQVLETAAPFAAGWLVAAGLTGAYRAGVVAHPGRMAARAGLAWAIGCPLGLGLRALIRQSGIPLSFAITTFLIAGAILLLWRVLFAVVAARRQAGAI